MFLAMQMLLLRYIDSWKMLGALLSGTPLIEN